MTDGPRTWRRRASAAAALVGLAAVLQLGAADAGTVQQPAVVAREAYFTNPITQVTPPLLRNGFPPATACLVAGLVGVPQVCGSEIQQLTALLGLSDGLPTPITPDGDLAQPIVLPNTTPVGMLGGQQRYASLLQLTIPPLADGERYGQFELVLHQDGLNFALESPALRDFVLQVLGQVEDQDPQKIADAIQRAITGEVPLVDQMLTGIEACPVTDDWNAGAAQGANLDSVKLPRTNCLLGTTGVFDDAAKTWTFDLTPAVQAWTKGVEGTPFANKGLMLRPVGAPNLAYGDPDLSTNWVVSLATSTAAAGLKPQVRFTTVPDDSAAGGSFDEPGLDVSLPSFDSGGALDLGNLPSGVGSAGLGGLRARYEDGVSKAGKGHNPGWFWIALPLGAAGAFVFAQSVGATPVANRRRPGALSRLEAEQ